MTAVAPTDPTRIGGRWVGAGSGVLDQGQTGACVAFAFATALSAAGVDRWPEGCRDAQAWARRAHRHVGRGGGDTERPTSIMNGAHVMVRFGLIEPDWEIVRKTDDILEALDAGPLVASLNWYWGMEHPHAGVCETTGEMTGRHAVAIVGRSRHRLRLRNSHGPEWGDNGEAWLHAGAFRDADGVAIRFTPNRSN